MDQDSISLDSFAADPQVRRKMELAYDKGRVVWLSLIALVMTVAIAGIPFIPDRPGHPHLSAIFCWLGAAFFGACAALLLARAIRRKPGLVLSGEGIYIESHSDETIPWRSVRDIRRYQRKRTDQLYIDLDPVAARTLTRRGLVRWFPKFLQGRATPAVISLTLLRADPDWVYNRCAEFLDQDRQQQALADRGLAVTSQAEDNEGLVFNLKGPPIFTYALITILIGIYVAELKFGVIPAKGDTPDTQTLLVLGGTFRQRILQYGEWWRLVTAALLHGSFIHLAFNCFALWRAGILLERLVGWRWFAALFCVSAVGGSVASLLINPDNIVGVGASGLCAPTNRMGSASI